MRFKDGKPKNCGEKMVMSVNFENPMNNEARNKLKELFADNIEDMDGMTVLLKQMAPLHQKYMNSIARAAGQVVSVELNEIGDRKRVGGVVYEMDEIGWKRLPIGTMLMNNKFKEVLKQAVLVCEYRGGDIDTEDGSYATTDIDSIIRLEAALCDALNAHSDDIAMLDVQGTIEAL